MSVATTTSVWMERATRNDMTGDRISLLARMGAVCDVYERGDVRSSVQSRRGSGAGALPNGHLEGPFDPVIFQSLVRALVSIRPAHWSACARPAGCCARSEPRDADQASREAVLSTKAGLPLKPQVLDLASPQATDQIEGREPPENWNFPYLTELWDGDDAALKQAR